MAGEKQLVVNLALKAGTMKQQINSINKDIKQLQTDFKNAGAGVEDFEKTSEGLSEKLKLQQSVVDKLKDKLEIYKAEQEKCIATLDKAVNAYQKQEQKVKSLEQALQEAKETYGENSEEVKSLEIELIKANKALDNKRNSVINANNSLTNMNTTISSTEAEIKAMEYQINQTTSALDELGESFDGASENSIDFNSKVSLIGQGMVELGDKATEAGKKVLDIVENLVESGSEYSAEVAGTEFLLKNLDSTTQEVINNSSTLASTIGLTSKQYKDSATSIATYYKNMGITTEESNKLTSETMNLVADLAAITDMPFDDAMGRFKSGLMGNYEALDAFGINLSATTLENSEWVKSLGKSWNSLSDNEKMMAAYNEIVRQSSSATGLASQEAGEFGMKSKYLATRLEEVKGVIGEKLLPVLQPLVEKIVDIVEKVAKWVEDNPELTRTILIIVGALGGFLAIIGPIISVLGALTLAVMAFNIASLPIMGTVALIALGITALIAVVVALWTNWDNITLWIKEKWNAFCEWVPEVVSTMGEWLSTTWTNIWNGVKDFISRILEDIKSTLKTWGENLWNFFTQTIPMWIDSIFKWFNELPYKIGYALGYTLTTILKWGTDAYNYLTTNVHIWINRVENYFSQLPNRIWIWLLNTYNNIVKWGINTYNNMVNSVNKTINSIETYFSQLPNKIWIWLINTIKKIENFAINMSNKATQAGINFTNNLINNLKSLPNKMVSIGKSIIKGIWKGVMDMGNWFSSKINSFFDGIVAGIIGGIKGKSSSIATKNSKSGATIFSGYDQQSEISTRIFQLDNIALSGSYYTPQTRDSVNANNIISKVNGESQTVALDRMMDTVNNALVEMAKTIQELKVNSDREVVLYATNNSYLDGKLIAKETTKQVISNVSKTKNSRRILNGGGKLKYV